MIVSMHINYSLTSAFMTQVNILVQL